MKLKTRIVAAHGQSPNLPRRLQARTSHSLDSGAFGKYPLVSSEARGVRAAPREDGKPPRDPLAGESPWTGRDGAC